MLCPKCGFISFDHFSVCVKCQNDLSQIGADLQGTATDAQCQHFLGLAHRETLTPPGDYREEEGYPSPRATPSADEAMTETSVQTDADLATDFDEESSLTFSEDESPGLEFDLDEIPQLDLSGFEPVAEDKTSTRVIPTETTTPDETAKQPDIISPSPADDQTESANKPLEIDALDLSMDAEQLPHDGLLDSEDAAEPNSQSSAAKEPSEQLTLDLDEIDLSDLVHQEKKASAIDNDTEGGLDFEDTMDLSLLTDEANEPIESTDFSFTDKGIEPIDLTLMDDALVELSVDPSRKGGSFQKEAPLDEFKLSMEDNPK